MLAVINYGCFMEAFVRNRIDNRTSYGEELEFDNLNDYDYSMDDFDTSLDKAVKGRLNIEDVVKRHRRVRRGTTKKDTVEHVTKIMESIEEELDDLKVLLTMGIIVTVE